MNSQDVSGLKYNIQDRLAKIKLLKIGARKSWKYFRGWAWPITFPVLLSLCLNHKCFNVIIVWTKSLRSRRCKISIAACHWSPVSFKCWQHPENWITPALRMEDSHWPALWELLPYFAWLCISIRWKGWLGTIFILGDIQIHSISERRTDKICNPPPKNSSTKSEVLLQSINQSVEKRTKQVCVKPPTTKVLQSFKESLLELFLWGLGSLKCVCSEFGVFLHLSEKRTGVYKP